MITAININTHLKTVKSRASNKTAFVSRQPLNDSVSFSGAKPKTRILKLKPDTHHTMVMGNQIPTVINDYIEDGIKVLRKNGGKMEVPSIFQGQGLSGTIELEKPSFWKRLIYGKTHDFSLKIEVIENFKAVPNKTDHLRISISQKKSTPISYGIIRATRDTITKNTDGTLIERQKLKADDLVIAGFDLRHAFEGIMKFSDKK